MSNHGHSKSGFYFADYTTYACPMCGQHGLLRIRRRLIDRVLSLFVRQRRFRCTQPGCQWQGNLSERPSHQRVTHEIGKDM